MTVNSVTFVTFFNSYKLLRPAGSYELQVSSLFTANCLLLTDISVTFVTFSQQYMAFMCSLLKEQTIFVNILDII
ncbi:hypothetical protein JCM30204_47020 [Dysgonomonas termitidis]